MRGEAFRVIRAICLFTEECYLAYVKDHLCWDHNIDCHFKQAVAEYKQVIAIILIIHLNLILTTMSIFYLFCSINTSLSWVSLFV